LPAAFGFKVVVAASAGLGLSIGTASAAISTRAVIAVISLFFVPIFVFPPFLILVFQRFLKNRWYYLHLRLVSF
jgi:hypothetical protein